MGFGSWIAAVKIPVDLVAFVVFAAQGQWPSAVMFLGFTLADVGIVAATLAMGALA